MKVLVSGSTGFIGNYVTRKLLSRDISVIATSADGEKAKTRDWFNKVNYVPFRLEDFDDKKDYYQFFGLPDRMIHLAWEGLPNYKDDFHEKINLPRHYSFLTNLIRNGLNDLTVTGTCFEYGMQEGKLDEEMAVFPSN
jgi:nucleoside-diphosphate-sugar epimerase